MLHTRLRPHCKEFLEKIAKLYELHVFTFGSRLYAHTIAGEQYITFNNIYIISLHTHITSFLSVVHFKYLFFELCNNTACKQSSWLVYKAVTVWPVILKIIIFFTIRYVPFFASLMVRESDCGMTISAFLLN